MSLPLQSVPICKQTILPDWSSHVQAILAYLRWCACHSCFEMNSLSPSSGLNKHEYQTIWSECDMELLCASFLEINITLPSSPFLGHCWAHNVQATYYLTFCTIAFKTDAYNCDVFLLFWLAFISDLKYSQEGHQSFLRVVFLCSRFLKEKY